MHPALRSLTKLARPAAAFAPRRAAGFTASLVRARSFATSNDAPTAAKSSVAPFLYTGPVSLVQQRAPDFTATALINGEFAPITMSQFRGRWVVLFFYPLDFTFVCPTEIIAFSDRANEFRALGAELLTASVDSEYSHLAWTNTPRERGGLGAIDIPMIADITKSISASYGVLLPEAGVALRGLFLIDPNQVVRQVTVNDLPIGRSVDETLRLLKALQFVEKHGEVCPADWTEGAATMKADPKGSQSYFKKAASKLTGR